MTLLTTSTPEQRARARALRKQIQKAKRAHRRPLFVKIRELLSSGMTPEHIANTLAPVIDQLLPLAALGPVGVVVEVFDGPVAWLTVYAIASGIRTP